jgi:L-fuconolactonase
VSAAASAGDDLVDAHQHLWDLAAHYQPWLALPGNEPLLRNFSESDLRQDAVAAGVTATVIMQTVTEPSETPELLAVAASSDLIAGVVGWVDLESADVADALAALRQRPDGYLLRGIRHPLLIDGDPDWLGRPTVHRGLAAVGAAGLCYDLVVLPHMLPAAVTAAAACSDVTFVLDHLGNPDVYRPPDDDWARHVRALAALPNTVCKLSGIFGEPAPNDGRPAGVAHLVPFYEIVLTAFGPDRLMFGTDYPVCTLAASYAEVVEAARTLTDALSLDERAAVFSRTARRVYRLLGQVGQRASAVGGWVK